MFQLNNISLELCGSGHFADIGKGLTILCSLVFDVFDDIDDQWNFLTVPKCLDEFIPLKWVHSKKSRQLTPWFTDAIQKKIKDKNHVKCVLSVQAIWMIDFCLENLRVT